jgi:hypothetical protein
LALRKNVLESELQMCWMRFACAATHYASQDTTFPIFSMCDEAVIYDTALNIPIAGTTHRYTIRGVVYLRDSHFTSRIIKPNGAVWYHDGILTGATCEQDGVIHALPQEFLNSCNIHGDVSMAVGVLYARAT